MHHFTARLTLDSPDLTAAARAWVWMHLRLLYPAALAVVVMPDHLHVVVDAPARRGREQLRRCLGQFARWFPGRWEPAPEPVPIVGLRKLRRQVRYVALNPCRAGLARDPVAWLWSTHRDVVGASVDPWVTPSRLARALGEREEGFGERHHGYVSSDPSVDVEGTPVPRPSPVLAADLSNLARAAALSTRGDPVGVFFHAGRAVRQPMTALAAFAGVPRSTAYARWKTPAPVAPVLLTLSDRRLLHPADARAWTPRPGFGARPGLVVPIRDVSSRGLSATLGARRWARS